MSRARLFSLLIFSLSFLIFWVPFSIIFGFFSLLLFFEWMDLIHHCFFLFFSWLWLLPKKRGNSIVFKNSFNVFSNEKREKKKSEPLKMAAQKSAKKEAIHYFYFFGSFQKFAHSSFARKINAFTFKCFERRAIFLTPFFLSSFKCLPTKKHKQLRNNLEYLSFLLQITRSWKKKSFFTYF